MPRKRGSHVNKYAHLAPKDDRRYSDTDKTFRVVQLKGKPNEIFPEGLRMLFHGRVYQLERAATADATGAAVGHFKLSSYVPDKLNRKRGIC